MYDKFDKFGLNAYPKEIRGRFNSFITTQFDDSLSVEMQLRSIIKWAKENFDETVNQTNHFIDFINDLIEYMNNFIDEFDNRLSENIGDILNDWLSDGTLADIINEDVFDMKADKTFVDSEIERLDQKDEDLTAQLAQKTTLTQVHTETGFADINKNLSKINETMLDDTLKQQITGDAPVSEVIPNLSVTTQKLADKSVTNSKKTVSGSSGFVTSLGTTFNVDTIDNIIEFPANTYVFYQNKATLVSDVSFTIPLASGALLYDITLNTLRCANPATASENEIMLGVTYKTALRINGHYTIDGVKQHITGINLFGYLVSISSNINVNTVTKTITFPQGNKYLFYGVKNIALPVDEFNYTYSNGFLWFDLKTNEFGSGSTKGHDLMIMLGYISDTTIYLNTNFTINGKANIQNNTITKEMLAFSVVDDIPTLTVESKHKGETGVTFGDSITWYDGQPFGESHTESGIIAKGYQTYMREQLQCTVDNKGASGQDMLSIANIIKAYDFTNTDFATLTSGANDARKGVPLGEIKPIGEQHDLTTYIGSMQSAIEYMLNNKKDIKIYLMTPIRGWYNRYNTPDVPNTDPDIVGMMKETYANAMKQVGLLYGLPVLDWYNLTGLNELTKNDFLGDTVGLAYYLHPTNLFYEKMSSSLIPFLNNY